MICSRRVKLSESPEGLIFNDEHFVCQSCTHKQPEEKIEEWTKTIMQNPDKGMPVSLWLIHEENKDKTIMTSNKPPVKFINREIEE